MKASRRGVRTAPHAPGEGRRDLPARQKPPVEVFLNVPYHKSFEILFLAYIAGVSVFGIVPRVTLENTSGSRRLEKIVSLIGTCRYSIHDLSRVQLDRQVPRTPRSKMPFELGLAVAYHRDARKGGHRWFVCEAMPRRLMKSLSELNGTDPHIHDGTIAGVFRELFNIFSRPGRQPTTQQMAQVYRATRRNLTAALHQSSSRTIYSASVFKKLSVMASEYADRFVR